MNGHENSGSSLTQKLLELYDDEAAQNNQRIEAMADVERIDPSVVDSADYAYRLGEAQATARLLGGIGQILLEHAQPDLNEQLNQLNAEDQPMEDGDIAE